MREQDIGRDNMWSMEMQFRIITIGRFSSWHRQAFWKIMASVEKYVTII